MDRDPELLPVRMLAQYAYCPRLFYLEWVDGEFRHNRATLEGKRVHDSMDAETRRYDGKKETMKTTSLSLSDEKVRLSGRMDLLEEGTDGPVPVETKRGEAPEGGPWPDHRIQLCAYSLLLEANGYGRVDRGVIYYAASRRRVWVDIDGELRSLTCGKIDEALEAAGLPEPPPPLQDSGKCLGCSLSPVCLPDEYWALKKLEAGGDSAARRIIPARDDSSPLYVQEHRARICRRGECLKIEVPGGEEEVKLYKTSQVNLFGNAQMTTQAVHACMKAGIPIFYFTSSGYFLGYSHTLSTRSSRIRVAQYESALDSTKTLHVSSNTVAAKIRNCRTMLRRNSDSVDKSTLKCLAALAEKTSGARGIGELMGMEGAAARDYFGAFGGMLKGGVDFDMSGRNRRPPRDPVNAMLSYAYGMLVKDCTIALVSVGLDPCLGFLHAHRHGRPSLALDLMEPFRPIIADSAVLYAINKGIVKPGDFRRRDTHVSMNASARKGIIASYERRMDQLVTHPVFDYRVSYRRVLEIQARLLARYVTGEAGEFTCFTTR